MHNPLRVLLLEDDPKDAELVLREVQRSGFPSECRRVETEKDYVAALAWPPDLVIADYSLPQFDGRRALSLMKAHGQDAPFILVSGSVGEERAVEMVLEGASAFVLKSRLEGLRPTIIRVLQEAETQREIRRAHEALKAEVELRKTIEDSMLGGLLSVDLEGRILHVNQFMCDMMGYRSEEMIGEKLPGRFVPPSEADSMLARFKKNIETQAPALSYEMPLLRKDGKLFDVWVVSSPLMGPGGRMTGRVAVVHDITGRKLAERQKEFQRLILETQLESSIDGILVVDEAEQWLMFNKRFVEMWNIPRAVVESRSDASGLSSILGQLGDPDGFRAKVRYLYEHRQEESRDEIVLKDGRVFDRYSAPMTGPDRRYYGRVWNFRDVTEGKRAEEERRLLSTAIEQASESVVITDPEGRILYVNPAFERMTGYGHAEAVGRNPSFLKSGRHDKAFYEQLWATLLRGETWHGRLVNRRKDGTLYEESSSIAPVRDASGKVTHYIAVKRDDSKERALEGQLLQAQKMEAIGRLAGGVAHDFNNILTVILGNCGMLLSGFSPEDPRHADLEEIRASGLRAAALTRQLLTFGRKQIVQPVDLDLNELIRNLEKMLKRILGEDIEMELSLDSAPAYVKADPGQIEQVVTNLVVNARDAMPKGGRLALRTSNLETCTDCPPGDGGPGGRRCVRLDVEDTGSGMPPEVLSRLFEPFFTTKPVGKGTGLGLSTAYGIIHQAGGAIRAKSEPGTGTVFTLTFPMGEGFSRPEAAQGDGDGGARGHETILLVEDEDGVRRLTERVLKDRGYAVLSAGSGEEALELLGKRSERVELLLTDVVMPRMSGNVLADRVAVLRPGIKVMFISGFAEHGELDDLIARHFDILQKPVGASDLAHAVRKLLDRK